MDVTFKGEFIRLDDILKISGIASTGGHAKWIIQNGEVKVNGEICTMRGKKLRGDEVIEYGGKTIKVKKCIF